MRAQPSRQRLWQALQGLTCAWTKKKEENIPHSRYTCFLDILICWFLYVLLLNYMLGELMSRSTCSWCIEDVFLCLWIVLGAFAPHMLQVFDVECLATIRHACATNRKPLEIMCNHMATICDFTVATVRGSKSFTELKSCLHMQASYACLFS